MVSSQLQAPPQCRELHLAVIRHALELPFAAQRTAPKQELVTTDSEEHRHAH
jgi:hypothetical protein